MFIVRGNVVILLDAILAWVKDWDWDFGGPVLENELQGVVALIIGITIL